MKCDIKDLVLDKVKEVNEVPSDVLGVSKHLCGAATDLALRSLVTFANSGSGSRLKAVQIALCCHHRCDWPLFVGKKFMVERFKLKDVAEFRMLLAMTSWATCGDGRPRSTQSKVSLDKKEKREDLGRKAKRILDAARMHFLIEALGPEYEASLSEYIDRETTPENVMLICHLKPSK